MGIKSHLKVPEMMACENKLHSNHSAADNFSKNIAELICGLMVFHRPWCTNLLLFSQQKLHSVSSLEKLLQRFVEA